jgi:hypothetical protein
LLLDPELIEASVSLTLRRAERGQADAAFVTARSLVERRPESGIARLDAGSQWSQYAEAVAFLRQGRREDARRSVSAEAAGPFLEACLDGRPPSEDDRRAMIDGALQSGDGEQMYYVGAAAALCGDRDASLELLEQAVEHNFCVAPPMDRDLAFADVRALPQFAAVHAAGLACHEGFKAVVTSSGGIPTN